MDIDDDELRRWPISDDLTVDLDGPYVIFRDGSSAGIDSDYDLGVLPEAAIRRLKITELGTALLAIDGRDDDEYPVDGWLIDTDPPNRIYDVEPLDGVMLHSGGRGGLAALIDI